MSTAQTIVNDALREIGVLAESETPLSDMANNAFRALNRLMETLSNERSFAYSNTAISKVLAGQSSFTIASTGGTWTADRPIAIDSAIVTSNSVDYPVAVIDSQEWDEITYKSSTGPFPDRVYYDATMPAGTLYVYPISTGATLKLRTISVVNSFATLATTLSMPPGYEECLIKNLAVNIAPQYPGCILSPLTIRQAASTLDKILSVNREIPELSLDPSLLGTTTSSLAAIYRG